MDMTFSRDSVLYQLLPALYRELDADQGEPLKALLSLIEGQADVVREDIARLWDDYFIETCQDWVIPYIGDLVANNMLYDSSRVNTSRSAEMLFRDLTGPSLAPELSLRARTDVAKTVYYRRRKGTLPMLEELTRDITGWAAHAVEFFQAMTWNQNLNHLRLNSSECIELRDLESVDRVHGPFDPWSHHADIRAPSQSQGWYNIPNIGFFIWRLGSYPMVNVSARQTSAAWRYTFSVLGNPAPLFNPWRREADESGVAGEYHMPGPVRRAYFANELEQYRLQTPPPTRPDVTDLFRPLDHGGSFHIIRNGVPVVPANDPAAPPDMMSAQLVCRRLDPWPASQPSGRVVAVDVVNGRITIGDGWVDTTDTLDVFFHYGFSADLGGGPYERGEWLIDSSLPTLQLMVKQDSPPPGGFTTIGAAITQWEIQGRPDCVITILDNRTYEEALSIALGDEAWLALEAASGVRPHIIPDGGVVLVTGNHPTAMLTLSGLMVEGAVQVTGVLQRLRVFHCTLVPGRRLNEDGTPATSEPSLEVADFDGPDRINTDLEVQIAFSILGPVRLPEHAAGLAILDSVVDGLEGATIAATNTSDQPGPKATLERVTLFGPSYFRSLNLATEVIFRAPVTVTQLHEGCVRFSYVPPASVTPRNYRCQPQFEIASMLRKAEQLAGSPLSVSEKNRITAEIQTWLQPSFTSRHYGHPGYAQLHLNCPRQIVTGGSDGAEMGVFNHLKQPQRETNLRIRLDEYLPFGLVPGIIYTT